MPVKPPIRVYPTHIYLIEQVNYGECGYVKIGTTSNLLNRYKSLRNSSPFQISEILNIKHDDPLRIEEYFINKYQKYICSGEWFYIDIRNSENEINVADMSYVEFCRENAKYIKQVKKGMADFLMECQ